MGKKRFRTPAIAAATLMYLILEYCLFSEFGWQGGLISSLFFSAFSLAALAGLLYRPPGIIPEEALEEELDSAHKPLPRPRRE